MHAFIKKRIQQSLSLRLIEQPNSLLNYKICDRHSSVLLARIFGLYCSASVKCTGLISFHTAGCPIVRANVRMQSYTRAEGCIRAFITPGGSGSRRPLMPTPARHCGSIWQGSGASRSVPVHEVVFQLRKLYNVSGPDHVRSIMASAVD